MQTLFELKDHLPYDPQILEAMRAKATELLNGVEGGQYTQAVVLRSASGREYGALLKEACSLCSSGEDTLLNALRAAGDTELSHVLCLWQDGGIDIPSYALRKMLIALHPRNADALLFVMTEKGVSVMRTAVTMK